MGPRSAAEGAGGLADPPDAEGAPEAADRPLTGLLKAAERAVETTPTTEAGGRPVPGSPLSHHPRGTERAYRKWQSTPPRGRTC